MSLPPAGWYTDPYDPASERWWTGEAWAEETRVPVPQSPPEMPTAPTRPIDPIGQTVSDWPATHGQPASPLSGSSPRDRSPLVAIIVVAVVLTLAVVGAAVALVLRTSGSEEIQASGPASTISEASDDPEPVDPGTAADDSAADDSAADDSAIDDSAADEGSVQIAEVVVSGAPLPPMDGSGVSGPDDPAVGMAIPVLVGRAADGSSVEIRPDGRPKVIYFLAHWCPHCQVELPKLVELVASGSLPEGLDLHIVSTAADPSRDNYPPTDWLAREGWTDPVIVDTDLNAALVAFGGTAFPFAVYVAADGTVAARSSGELDTKQIVQLWRITAQS